MTGRDRSQARQGLVGAALRMLGFILGAILRQGRVEDRVSSGAAVVNPAGEVF